MKDLESLWNPWNIIWGFWTLGIVQIARSRDSASIALLKTQKYRIATSIMTKNMFLCVCQFDKISLFEEINLQCDLRPNRYVENDRILILSL